MGAIEGMPVARILTRLLPVADGRLADRIDLADDDAEARLAEWYAAPRAWWRMNMIGTLNARVTGPDGTSDTLSNRADRTILQHLRRASDAVLVGAETVRSERHAPVGGAVLAVVTGSGDLAGNRIPPAEAEHGVIVLCPPAAAACARATMPGARIEHPPLDAAGRVAMAELRAFLSALGRERVVVEGGGRLISQVLDAGLLDEACLTQAPVFGRSEAPSLPGSGHVDAWRRTLLAVDERGFLYARLERADAAAEAI